MNDYTKSYLRARSTSDLNAMLSNASRPDPEPRYPKVDIGDVQAEKDRRLADPNSPDFRPTFF